MAQECQKYGSARTLCEFVTGIGYVLEVSGGLNDRMSDRLDDLIDPVRKARDWLWFVGELMSQKKPLPADFDHGLQMAEARARAAMPEFKALLSDACDALANVRPQTTTSGAPAEDALE